MPGNTSLTPRISHDCPHLRASHLESSSWGSFMWRLGMSHLEIFCRGLVPLGQGFADSTAENLIHSLARCYDILLTKICIHIFVQLSFTLKKLLFYFNLVFKIYFSFMCVFVSLCVCMWAWGALKGQRFSWGRVTGSLNHLMWVLETKLWSSERTASACSPWTSLVSKWKMLKYHQGNTNKWHRKESKEKVDVGAARTSELSSDEIKLNRIPNSIVWDKAEHYAQV